MFPHLKCLLKALTGFDCPFCGVQRGLDAMFHGDLSGMWHYNPYLVIISPYLILVLLAVSGVIPVGSRLQRLLYDRRTIIAAGVMTLSWWIFRNIISY